MFYLDKNKMDSSLRFGDIIQGFPICFPEIQKPSHKEAYHIKVESPSYAVVLSPCCSISDKVLSIAPLQELSIKIFSNPFLADEPTNLNIKIPAEKSLPPKALEGMSPDKKANILSKGDAYVFVDWFVYAEHSLFPKYAINHKFFRGVTTGFYMVDFRNAIRIGCNKIINPAYKPETAKVLQLTVDSRKLLREKISAFYNRITDEDAAELAS